MTHNPVTIQTERYEQLIDQMIDANRHDIEAIRIPSGGSFDAIEVSHEVPVPLTIRGDIYVTGLSNEASSQANFGSHRWTGAITLRHTRIIDSLNNDRTHYVTRFGEPDGPPLKIDALTTGHTKTGIIPGVASTRFILIHSVDGVSRGINIKRDDRPVLPLGFDTPGRASILYRVVENSIHALLAKREPPC